MEQKELILLIIAVVIASGADAVSTSLKCENIGKLNKRKSWWNNFFSDDKSAIEKFGKNVQEKLFGKN